MPTPSGIGSPSRRGFWARGRCIGGRGSATAGCQIVRIASRQARPLSDGASARPHWLPSRRAGASPCRYTVAASRGASLPMAPAVRRRSSRATGSCYPSPRRHGPSSSKSRRPWRVVAGSKRCNHAHPASNQEGVERVLRRRVPRHLPAHEVAVPGALFVRALAKHGEGDVARMNIGQLAGLRCNPGTPLALLRRGTTGVPHEVVGDEHFEEIDRKWPTT